MKGHIRRRGASWEFIIDVGMAAAQRCEGCGRRFWVERKPKAVCPACGGTLAETEERRRQTQAGFADEERLPGGDGQGDLRHRGAALRAAGPPDREGVPAEGVAAGDRGHGAGDHLQKLRSPCRLPHRAGAGEHSAAEAQRRDVERLLCQAQQRGARPWRGWPLTRHRPAECTPPCTVPCAMRSLEQAVGQSGRCRRSTEMFSGEETTAGLEW